MANLVLAMFVTLDGYISGPNGEFTPPPWSNEVAEAWSAANLKEASHLIYGRVNFQFNKNFWTSPAAAGVPQTEIMNRLPKTVVSRTLSGAPGWNAAVLRDDLAGAVQALKNSVTAGKIYSFGGAGIANSLMSKRLVDEYRLMVTPRLAGDGKRLFDAGIPGAGLELLDAKRLDTGSVILHYRNKPRGD